MEHPSTPAQPVSNPSRDGWKSILKIVLSFGLVGLVVSRTNIQQVFGLGEYISWPWLIASFGLFCLTTLIKTLQYWILLGGQASYRQTLKIVIIQNALTNFVANTAGIVSYLTMFQMEQNVKVQRSGAVFLLTKAGDILSMEFFLLVSALFVWNRVPMLQELVLFILIGVGLSLAVFWAALFLRQRFVSFIRSASRRLGLNRLSLVERGLSTLDSLSTQDGKTVIRFLLLGGILSLIYLTTTMAYFYSRAQTFQIPLDLWAIIFIGTLMQFVSIIPFQVFGGLGVAEVGLVYLYGLFGITQSIPAILVGLRVLFYLFNLILLIYIPLDIFFNYLFARSDAQ